MVLGVDVGGTFTDAVLLAEDRLVTGKAPRRVADPPLASPAIMSDARLSRRRFLQAGAAGAAGAAALSAAGIRVPYSCKGGMCCTCRAKVVEGKADMVVNYSLEPWEIERGFILTCQAVPKSERLVLDYDAM